MDYIHLQIPWVASWSFIILLDALGKLHAFQTHNFREGPWQNLEMNLNLIPPSRFLSVTLHPDSVNRTLSLPGQKLNNWAFSGSPEFVQWDINSNLEHNAPVTARNGCSYWCFQWRSHHTQQGSNKNETVVNKFYSCSYLKHGTNQGKPVYACHRHI